MSSDQAVRIAAALADVGVYDVNSMEEPLALLGEEAESAFFSELYSDLSSCPGCGGPADNGFDRCVPPSPYYCTKCDPKCDKCNAALVGSDNDMCPFCLDCKK